MRAPIDRYVAGRCWLAFYRAHFSGVVFWGTVDGPALRELGEVFEARYAPPGGPHPSMVDLRQVEAIDASVFDVRTELIAATSAMVRESITRAAIIHPLGLIGAIALGLRALAPPPFPEQFFTDPHQALAWLGREQDIPLLDELELIRTRALGSTPLLRDLRALVDADPRAPLAAIARRLGVSTRSLQRRLAEAGTTYQDEQTLATVRAAQRLLLDDGASVTRVAFDVGCATPQHLTRLFRRAIGETPSSWRKRCATSTRLSGQTGAAVPPIGGRVPAGEPRRG